MITYCIVLSKERKVQSKNFANKKTYIYRTGTEEKTRSWNINNI